MDDEVRLTSPDKVLWPETGHTKRDLRDHVVAMADRLLPHLVDRPLSVKRFPEGVDQKGFFQKNLQDHAPDSIERWRVFAESADREVAYALVDTADDLAWFAQQNTVEFHPSVMRIDQPDRVDHLVIDIDPGTRDLPPARVARWTREVLDDLGLAAVVNTSGGRGLHVRVPIERRYGPDVVRPITLAVARMAADRHPDDLTVEMRKDDRGDRTLLDWSRSTPGATLIAPWSPRAHPRATVATPLSWDEVSDDLDPTAFTLDTVADRDDPWVDGPGPQRLEHARDALVEAGWDLVDASPRGRTANALGP